MFFTVLLFTLFIAADCTLRKNDGKVESNECKDTNIHCATWKKLCHAGPDYKPVIEMCKETCGLCKATKFCPPDHPFAYFMGALCCMFNKEDIHLPAGSKCDGSELSSASVCCKDNMLIQCPNGKCETNPVSTCPVDHPFPYFKGTFCCKSNKERVDPQFGSYCDGSEISSSSMCCKDNKYILCPHGKCVASTVDPCTIKNGGCSHICKSKRQAVTCSCKDGFKLKTDGKTCVRIDPCTIKNGGCSHMCKSKGPAVTCSCKDGFQLKTDGKTCVRIGPCAIKNGGCTHICKSKGQAVTCSCKDGFKLKTDGKTCLTPAAASALCKSARVISSRIRMGKSPSDSKEHTLMCGTRITGFRIRATNWWLDGIQLKCSGGMETNTTSDSTVGTWGGSWKPWKVCEGEKIFVKGVNYRREIYPRFSQGTNIKMQCSDDIVMDGGGPAEYDWAVPGFKECPSGQYFCGVRTWVYNIICNIEFICCRCQYM